MYIWKKEINFILYFQKWNWRKSLLNWVLSKKKLFNRDSVFSNNSARLGKKHQSSTKLLYTYFVFSCFNLIRDMIWRI